jgi:hypothetical protein
MLGLNNARLNQLEADNRRLRADLVAQLDRNEAQRLLIAKLQRERNEAAQTITALTAATQAATQAVQGVRGYVLGGSVLDRICRN